jgi:hypothetical protein
MAIPRRSHGGTIVYLPCVPVNFWPTYPSLPLLLLIVFSFRRTVLVFVHQSRSWSLVASAFYSTAFTMSTRVVQLQFPTPNRPGHIRSTSTSSIPNNLERFLAEPPQSPLPAFGQGGSPSLVRPDAPPNTSQTLSGMVTPTTGAFG